jgi:hypothetical protein
MMQTLFSRVSMLGQRAVAFVHRSAVPEGGSAERRAKWNAAIAEHRRTQQPEAAPPPAATRR